MIQFTGVDKLELRPRVDQQGRTATAVCAPRIPHHDVQIAIVVDVDELSAGAPDPPSPSRQGLPFTKTKTSVVQIQSQTGRRREQQVLVSVLIWIACGRTEHIVRFQPHRLT